VKFNASIIVYKHVSSKGFNHPHTSRNKILVGQLDFMHHLLWLNIMLFWSFDVRMEICNYLY